MATRLDILNELLFIANGNSPEFAESLAKYYSKTDPNSEQFTRWLNEPADPEWESSTRKYFAENREQLLAELQQMVMKQPLKERMRNLNASASFRVNKVLQEQGAYEAAESIGNKKVDLYRMGLEWWPRTYAKSPTDLGATRAVLELAETLEPELGEHFKDLMFSTVMRTSILGPARWAD